MQRFCCRMINWNYVFIFQLVVILSDLRNIVLCRKHSSSCQASSWHAGTNLLTHPTNLQNLQNWQFSHAFNILKFVAQRKREYLSLEWVLGHPPSQYAQIQLISCHTYWNANLLFNYPPKCLYFLNYRCGSAPSSPRQHFRAKASAKCKDSHGWPTSGSFSFWEPRCENIHNTINTRSKIIRVLHHPPRILVCDPSP